MIRLLSPFGPEALPIDRVSRTNSTSDGVMTMFVVEIQQKSEANLEEQRLDHLIMFDFESSYSRRWLYLVHQLLHCH